MPYGKGTYKGRKKQFKKRNPADAWASKGEKAARVAYKGWALAKKLARFVNTEQKIIQTEFTIVTNAAGNVLPLSLIGQGDNHGEREGISIKNSRLSGRLHFIYDAAATNSSCIRLIIFKWKQESGVLPTVAQVLDTTGSLDYLAPKLYTNRFQSKILYDRIHVLNEAGNMAQVQNLDIKLFGHTNYNNTGNTITALDDGGYYMLTICDVAGNQPVLSGVLRLSFVDN